MTTARLVSPTKPCHLPGDCPILQSEMGGMAGPDLAAEVVERMIQEVRALLLKELPQAVPLDK